VGIACAELGYTGLRFALAHAEDPAGLAAELLPQLDATDPPWPTLDRAFLGERLSAWDCCQRLYVPGQRPGTWSLDLSILRRTSLGEMTAPMDMSGLVPKVIDYDQTLAEFDAYYDAYVAWIRSPYHEVANKTDQFKRMKEKSRNNLFLTLTPDLTRPRVLAEQIAAERRATHLICHLLTHRAKVGAYPDSLDELEATDLAQLRIDPFSGEDFVYRKTADGFTLYTVAQDLKDDGGKHDERWGRDGGGDFVFWPVPD
jgi:hypothetical protein